MNSNSPINLVLFYCGQRTGHFGAGSHIGSLLPYIKREENIRLLVIRTDDKEAETVSFEKENGMEVLCIPQPENKLFLTCSQDQIQKTYAKRLVEIIYPYIKDLENPLFWVNSIDYLNVCFELKDNLDGQLLYVHHAWSWKCYNNVSDPVFAEVFKKGNEKTYATAIEFTRFQQALAMLSDHVITVTDQAKDFFTQHLGVPDNKIRPIYNGMDPIENSLTANKNVLRRRLGIRPDEKVILYTGRIRADKGLAYLINGFKKVLEKYPDCRLVLVGKGDFEEFIPLTYPNSSKVTFTGKLNQAELYHWYRIADIGVLPSLHEQCSYTAIEMRFFQVPLIVSGVDGLDEMFLNEHDALKLDVRFDEKGEKVLDTHEIAENIIRLLSDRPLRENLVENGLKEANNKFTAEKMWLGYKGVLNNIYSEHLGSFASSD